jgi:hypothetical protein
LRPPSVYGRSWRKADVRYKQASVIRGSFHNL